VAAGALLAASPTGSGVSSAEALTSLRPWPLPPAVGEGGELHPLCLVLAAGLAAALVALLCRLRRGAGEPAGRGHHQQRAFAVFEETPDFVAITTADGRPLYLNRAARTTLGVPPGEKQPRGVLRDWLAEIGRASCRGRG